MHRAAPQLERTTQHKPGRPSLEFLFLGKVGRSTRRNFGFCVFATHVHKKKVARLLHATAGGIFALSLHGLMGKKALTSDTAY